MPEIKPLKLKDLGGGDGQLREFESGDKIAAALLALEAWATAATPDAALTELQFTAVGKALAKATDPAAGRTALGLGSAATLSVAPAYYTGNDIGYALKPRDYGLGYPLSYSQVGEGLLNDLDVFTQSMFFQTSTGIANLPPGITSNGSFGLCMPYGDGSTHTSQLVISRSSTSRVVVRVKSTGVWQSPNELYGSHTSAALPITGSLSPSVDNSVSYGVAARRPTQLYAMTTAINTSDGREKTPVRVLTDAEYAVGLQLAREAGAYQWLEAVAKKGAGARWHFGQTVQRAIEIFEQHGLDPFAYGAICYDEWEQETIEHSAEYEEIEIPAVLGEDGSELDPARVEQGALIREAWVEVTQEAGDRYSWRDNELLWLMTAATVRRQDEIERRLAALEA
jgi:hypothetical protein